MFDSLNANEFLAGVISLVLPLFLIFISKIVVNLATHAQDWLAEEVEKKKTELKEKWKIMLMDEIHHIVKELMTTVVKETKEMFADGKITKEEKTNSLRNIKNIARLEINKFIDNAPSIIREFLRENLGGKIENAVTSVKVAELQSDVLKNTYNLKKDGASQ